MNLLLKYCSIMFVFGVTIFLVSLVAKKVPRHVDDGKGKGNLAPSRLPVICGGLMFSLLFWHCVLSAPSVFSNWDEFKANAGFSKMWDLSNSSSDTDMLDNSDYIKYEYYTVKSKCVEEKAHVSGGGGFIFHSAVRTTYEYIFENGFSTNDNQTSDGAKFYEGAEYNLVYVKVFTRDSVSNDWNETSERVDHIESV